MKTFGRRTLSVILSVIMVLSCFAGMTFSVGAETSGDYEYEVLEDGTVSLTEYNGTDTDVIIPSEIDGRNVTKIDSYLFYYNRELISVTIPDSVTEIGYGVFEGCESLKNISVDEENTVYKSVDGVLFNKDMTLLMSYPGNREVEYSIPDGVTTIDYYAFNRCAKITSVVIPDSVTKIDIGAFQDCTMLENISISSSVTTIGMGAFHGCSGLNSINVDENNEVYKSVDGILFNKDMTEIVAYPGGREGDYVIPDGVKKICGDAFSGCFNLTSVTIPDSVKEIGDGAFYNCPKLTSVKIPDGVSEIGYMTFAECEGLTITIPASVTVIDSGAFWNCTTLYIYGYSGSEAENFANENGYTFISLDSCSHSDTELVNAKEATCAEKGYTGDKVCIGCDIILEKGTEIPARGHEDGDNDGICDICGEEVKIDTDCDTSGHIDSDKDGICDSCGDTMPEVKNCKCICHKGGFSGFIYKIIRFLWKIFRMNQTCDCGLAHY